MGSKDRITVNINIDWRIVLILCLTIALAGFTFQNVAGNQGIENPAKDTPSKAGLFTGYYNLISYEGIGTAGEYGETPPGGDYVSTYCRFINVQNTTIGQYVLQYPLHLPNGATITEVAIHMADFNPSGRMSFMLFRRPWDSRNTGTSFGDTTSSIGIDGDATLTMSIFGEINLKIDNSAYEYWVAATPENSTSPGQLCVYSVQVTYTIDGSLLPLITRDY